MAASNKLEQSPPESCHDGAADRPRIAMLIHALHGGGAEKLMSQLASRWVERYEVHLITWSSTATDTYAVDERVRRIGLNLMKPSRSALDGLMANWRRLHALRRELAALKPDLVLSFADQMNILSLEASRGISVPHIISEHSNPERQKLSRFWELWRQRSYPRAAAVHVLTDAVGHYMSRWISPTRLHVIPPAINPPASGDGNSQAGTADSSRAVGAESGSPTARCNVLFVGRLSEEKGVARLLAAWQRVAVAAPHAWLTIVGDGPLRSQLEQQASSMRGVHFRGWVDDPWAAYADADLFVLPSRYEGFPVAMLEAMASGCACVSTNCTAALQELNTRTDRNESSGLAVNVLRAPADNEEAVVEELVETLSLLCNDRQQRDRQSRAGREVALRYTWGEIGPMWDALLQRTLGGK